MRKIFDADEADYRTSVPLRSAALDSLFTGLKPMVIGFVPSLGVIALIAAHAGDIVLTLTVVATIAVVAWRLAECWRYHAVPAAGVEPSMGQVRRWELRYGIPAALYALFIGTAAARITMLGDPYFAALAMIVAVSNLTGAVSRNAGVQWIVIAQIVATLAPTSLVLGTGTPLQQALTLLLLPAVLCFHWLADRQRNILLNAASARAQVEDALQRSEADAGRLRAALAATADALKAKATAEERSRLDNLTGLYDASQLDATLKRAARTDEVALVLLDLDGFKRVNAAHGRRGGDRLLRECAGRLWRIAQSDPLRDETGIPALFRMGGDRFASVVAGRDAPARARREVAQVMEALREPFDLVGTDVRLHCSAGIALCSGGDLEGLVSCAEMALEDAKAQGAGQWRLFDPAVGERVSRARRIEADLPHAISRGEMLLHFQPLVNLKAGRVTTCEALLRWTHGELGPVSPGEFVPVAERSGAIEQLGDFVLVEACKAAMAWPEDVRVAVNLSPRQFRDRDLAAHVRRVLARTGLAPPRLELELTEGAVVEDPDHAHTVIASLRELGVRTALDDFGTGHSSLSLLGALPFDKVKLDRSFVTAAQSHSNTLVLVNGLMRVAGEMGLGVVVEGVETAEQLNRLTSRSQPDEVQGYLFFRPLPERDVRSLLERMPADTTAARGARRAHLKVVA